LTLAPLICERGKARTIAGSRSDHSGCNLPL
jgi:hypothetical protein